MGRPLRRALGWPTDLWALRHAAAAPTRQEFELRKKIPVWALGLAHRAVRHPYGKVVGAPAVAPWPGRPARPGEPGAVGVTGVGMCHDVWVCREVIVTAHDRRLPAWRAPRCLSTHLTERPLSSLSQESHHSSIARCPAPQDVPLSENQVNCNSGHNPWAHLAPHASCVTGAASHPSASFTISCGVKRNFRFSHCKS